ncbi:MAG TPA: hypothetical protein VHJ20_12285 [Polyangia bacterium]|nr:hypothetical protein [Polyangia bacterium]
MSTLHARVEGGHIVVDEVTDLPEGTRLTLVMVEVILATDEVWIVAVRGAVQRRRPQAAR